MKRSTATPANAVRLREAMAALLSAGSSRKAAALCGIPDRTIAAWARSAEGIAVLDELRRAGAEEILEAQREIKTSLVRVVKEQIRQYEEALHARKIQPRDLAIHLGINLDKLARMTPSKAEAEGDLEVSVEFGGKRVAPQASDASAGEVIAGRVTVKKEGA